MSSSQTPPPSQSPFVLAQPVTTTTRRLPPPCWSPDETVALIDAYREKWYTLRRGNLRNPDWQDVADTVASECPPPRGVEPKTSTQCRHKMEKLRKRYRAEVSRGASTPMFKSSWVHFARMDAMDKGVTVAEAARAVGVRDEDFDGEETEDEGQEEEEGDGDEETPYLYPSGQRFYGVPTKPDNGFRVSVSGKSVPQTPVANVYGRFDDHQPNVRHGSMKNIGVKRRDESVNYGSSTRTSNNSTNSSHRGIEEMVSAIKTLGEGFDRVERMKMENARQLEAMRMEMEMRRTEMILKSQERIVETFSKALGDRDHKKAKKMPPPES